MNSGVRRGKNEERGGRENKGKMPLTDGSKKKKRGKTGKGEGE